MTRRSLRVTAAALACVLAILTTGTNAAGAAATATSDKVNINTAGVEELMALPGIGKAYAERILEYRQKNGPFKTAEDLLNVRGIGEKTFEKIKDRLTVGKN
jgi:competence protein ComEA